MNPKTYLMQIQKLNTKINQRKQQIVELKSTIYGLKGGSLGEKVSGGAKSEATFVASVERLQAMEKELSAFVIEYVEKKDLIISQIQSMENKNYLNLLYKRYVEGKRLELIAVEMNYSYSHIKKIHGWALVAFKKKFLLKETLIKSYMVC